MPKAKSPKVQRAAAEERDLIDQGTVQSLLSTMTGVSPRFQLARLDNQHHITKISQ